MKKNQISNIKTQKFIFFSLAKTGEGISGSDRIFIELARNWSKKNTVEIYTSPEGLQLCRIQELEGAKLKIVSIPNKSFEFFFILNYLLKILYGIWLGLTLKPTTYNLQPITYLYSASDFWMDFFPGLILKLRFKQLNWVATWYQTAPNPFVGFKEGERESSYQISAFLYWLSQLPIKPLIKRFADFVIVNNEDERNQFLEMDKRGKVIVLLGAVRLTEIEKWISDHRPLTTDHQFDAVFQGRFHPQKGVVELVDIWKKVVEIKPNAKLAMIGDGPLMEEVKRRITMNELTGNVSLFGYVFDGPKKYEIFSSSKIVVHPAFYDSGGMASAEAMAFGLPAVGFNLKAYQSYYPSGMVKVEIGDKEAFANEVVRLLNDEKYKNRVAAEAIKMIKSNWSWDKRAKEVLGKIS